MSKTIGAVRLPTGAVVSLGVDLRWRSEDARQAELFDLRFSPLTEAVEGGFAGLPFGCATVARAAEATGGEAVFPAWGDELVPPPARASESAPDGPGTHPPHPGLVYDPDKHRYVKPGDGAGGDAGGAGGTAPAPEKPAVTYPAGFTPAKSAGSPGSHDPNPHVPNATRPQLSLAEAKAAHAYSDINVFGPLNAALRAGKPPKKAGALGRLVGAADPAGVHEQLQAAFQKAPVMHPPVPLKRGITVPDPEAFAAWFRSQADAGQVVALPDYQSCSTMVGGTAALAAHGGTYNDPMDVPGGYSGNVRYTIHAVHGLDLKPYSKFPQENEVLLPAGAKYRVGRVEKRGSEWHIELFQQPPEGK